MVLRSRRDRPLAMPFAYYDRLSRRDQETYRRSDGIASVALENPERLRPFVDAIAEALRREDRRGLAAAATSLSRGLLEAVGVGAVEIEILAVRPTASWGELHGLYTREGRSAPRIQLWMRTARRRRVVAFRTFLRTLLHELGHHLDYELLKLADSFHTEGFFRRESSLFQQLVPEVR